ncbi:hypothetical protein ASE11_18535 [Hydrogenophaga sp. Root209]|nr:hypothetical protein ASE11_18535 [Hydrogenophaga sp. Root209]
MRSGLGVDQTSRAGRTVKKCVINGGKKMLKTLVRIAFLMCCLALSTAVSAQSLRVHIVEKCPVTGPAKPPETPTDMAVAAGLILQQVISKGVDIAASALTAAAKDKVTTLSGESAVVDYYVVGGKVMLGSNPKMQCIVLLMTGTGSPSNPEWMKKLAFKDNPMGISTVPNFYMEVELEHLSNNGLKATPQFIYIGKSLAEGHSWFRKQDKDYVVAVSLNAEESGTSFGAMTFAFKNIDTGTAYARVPPDGLQIALPSRPDWPIPARLPKLPETDLTKEAVAARKTSIASYVEANSILKKQATADPLVKKPIETHTKYTDAVRTLCEEVKAANKSSSDPKSVKADAGKFSDPRCPIPLWTAKLDADKAAVDAQKASDLVWATAFFQKNCSKGALKNEAKGDVREYESCKLPGDNAGTTVGGFYAAATVVETSEASAFLKSVASAFSEDKDKLKTALNDRFNPMRRDELSAEAVASDRDARQKYQLALLKVSQIDAALQEASGGTLSSRKLIEMQLVQAKIDANAAARTAGASAPFPELD